MKQVVAANLFRGKEAVGGRLHFEEQRMVFKSHAFNIQTGETVILKNGVEHKFVVWNRKEIIAFLREKAGGVTTGHSPGFPVNIKTTLIFPRKLCIMVQHRG